MAHAAVVAMLGSTDLSGGPKPQSGSTGRVVFSLSSLLSFPSLPLPLRLSLSEGNEKVNDLQRRQSAVGGVCGGHGRTGSSLGIHRKHKTVAGKAH